MENRKLLRTTFDRVVSLYDEARLGYPEALFEDVVSLSRIPEGGRILEIGCGTGKATLPLARRGYGILCVELGENLAAFTRRKLAGYPRVEVLTGAFEDWGEKESAFDLVVSAESFHWLKPAPAYRKIFRALRPDGAIALFWNRPARSERDEGFFAAAREVYLREAPELVEKHPPRLPKPDEVSGRAEGIEESGLFGALVVRRYPWEAEYDAESYTRLLGTYSDHISLDDAVRDRLFRAIADLIDTEFGGRIVKGYVSVLYLAHVRAGNP